MVQHAIVTGATGFIGAHLVKVLSEHGVTVYALCRRDSAGISRIDSLPNVNIIECELQTSQTYVSQIPAGVDVFYHLAWENASGALRQSFLPQVGNVQLLEPLVNAAKELGCKKIVAAGTASEKLCERIDTADDFFKAAFYLQSKRYAHSMLKQLAAKESLDFVWCTFCHPIGRYNKTDQIIASTISKLLRDETPVFGSGQQLFDVIAAEDLAEGFYLAGERTLEEKEYYIGSGRPQKLRAYLERVRDLISPGADLHFGALPDDGLVLEAQWLDSSVFFGETGFFPRFDFDEAVFQTRAWVNPE